MTRIDGGGSTPAPLHHDPTEDPKTSGSVDGTEPEPELTTVRPEDAAELRQTFNDGSGLTSYYKLKRPFLFFDIGVSPDTALERLNDGKTVVVKEGRTRTELHDAQDLKDYLDVEFEHYMSRDEPRTLLVKIGQALDKVNSGYSLGDEDSVRHGRRRTTMRGRLSSLTAARRLAAGLPIVVAEEGRRKIEGGYGTYWGRLEVRNTTTITSFDELLEFMSKNGID